MSWTAGSATASLAGATWENRGRFIDSLAELFADWGLDRSEAVRAALTALLADVTDHDLRQLALRLENTGREWTHYPADPVARRLSRAVIDRILGESSALENAAVLEEARARPVVLVGNHLSYIDVNVLDYLVARAGYTDVANRVTTLVGPKVFTHPIRRLASLCFGTLKLPQSSSRASGEAVMQAREVARLAHKTIAAASARQEAGDQLLVFPEGSRSRDASMQRCLAAVARYLDEPEASLLPWAHTGCEKLFPVGDEHVHRADVQVRLGPPISVRALREASGRSRQRVADVVGFLIADLLPPEYRGAYAETSGELARASEIARALGG